MSELGTRALSGVLMIALALGAAYMGGTLFAGLVALAAVAMFYEWSRIVKGWGAGWRVAGFLYALIPALALLWIRERFAIDGVARGFELLLWVFITTWATDIGAYFAGRTLGGPKLAPRISPNKTISGLIGGMAAAELFGALYAGMTGLPPLLYFLGAPLAFAAQMGDLFESHLKRRAGVKDSGQILPGHGGALDRLDGLVVVATLTAAVQLSGLL